MIFQNGVLKYFIFSFANFLIGNVRVREVNIDGQVRVWHYSRYILHTEL